jgi:hypothetical protein
LTIGLLADKETTVLPETLRIGDVSAEPGETKWGPATWVELREGTRVHLPVILVNGRTDGPRVVVTAAVHPTELVGTAAVQIVTRKRIDPSKLKGSIIAFPITNPLGMQFGQYVSPHDGSNMYVSYPGSKDGTVTSRLAHFIWENAAKGADLAIDCHENTKPCIHFSIFPEPDNQDTERKALEMAEAFGLTVIRTRRVYLGPGVKPADVTYIKQCMNNGIPAFAPEFEGSTELTFGEDETTMKVAVRGFMNVFKKLGMIPGEAEPQREIKVLKGDFEARGNVRANRGGIVHRGAEVGVKLPKGTPIAKVVSPYGDELETVEMPIDGYIWGWNIGDQSVRAVQPGSNIALIFSER